MSEAVGRIVPNRVWFSLTGNCNNACVWCYRSGSECHTYLDSTFVLMAAKTLASCGTKKCTLIGGEPTLHPDYVFLCQELTTLMSTTLVTNGRLLSKGFPLWWGNNERLHVVVSLHGADQEHYVYNTGRKKGYGETVKAIQLLVKHRVRHSVNVVLSKENLPRIGDFIQTTARLGAELLCFTIAISSVDDETYASNPFALVNVIGNVHERCRAVGQKHCFIFNLPWCLLEGELLKELIENRELIFNCPMDTGRGVVVKENGAMTVCTHLSSFEVLDTDAAKRVLTNPAAFLAFWNALKMQELRKAVNVYRDPRCAQCRYCSVCKGGCPLWWKDHDFRVAIHPAQ